MASRARGLRMDTERAAGRRAAGCARWHPTPRTPGIGKRAPRATAPRARRHMAARRRHGEVAGYGALAKWCALHRRHRVMDAAPSAPRASPSARRRSRRRTLGGGRRSWPPGSGLRDAHDQVLSGCAVTQDQTAGCAMGAHRNLLAASAGAIGLSISLPVQKIENDRIQPFRPLTAMRRARRLARCRVAHPECCEKSWPPLQYS
jgi:hypothetical protein